MNVTPKTHATLVRKANNRKVAVTPDVRRKAYTSQSGDKPRS